MKNYLNLSVIIGIDDNINASLESTMSKSKDLGKGRSMRVHDSLPL